MTTPQQRALTYLTHIANAFDPVEGPVHFDADPWSRIRNAIYDLSPPRLEMPSQGAILMACGELNASELRAVKAALAWFIGRANG